MAYGDFKELAKITASEKVLRDKAFNIAKNPKCDGYQRSLAAMGYKFFHRKSASLVDKSNAGSVNTHEDNERPLDLATQKLAKELHKPIIKTSKKIAVYSGFKDNIWGADLADIQLISKFNKAFRFLLCIINIFSKHARVVSLKDKKGVSIVNIR